MKATVLSTIFCCLWMNLMAQAPESLKYQAVVRNSSGEILIKKTVNFRFSILQGSTTGTVVYRELHSRTTNDFGLVDLEIGKGTSPSGTFSGINWGGDSFFLQAIIISAVRHTGWPELETAPDFYS